LKKTIAIIGGGASALMLAATLNQDKFDVCVYEKNNTLGRKFLVAGDGGFNLTHSESIDHFTLKYTPDSFLKSSLLAFDNEDFRIWLKMIGVDTFIGSSKRVYPLKGIKPIDVLNAYLNVLKEKQVKLLSKHTFTGFGADGELIFNDQIAVKADYSVFALGGASWAKTGSDGTWLKIFENKDIHTIPFQASNCAYKVNWDQIFIKQFAGHALKNIKLSSGNKTVLGELVITPFGLEGGAIYALSPEIRHDLNKEGKALIYLDLKPQLQQAEVFRKLKSSHQKNTSERLRSELNLSSAQMAVIKSLLIKEDYQNLNILSEKIKALQIIVTDFAPIDEAISVAGGIALEEVTEYFELKKMPQHFVIGEMLDWDAPTGGYLLQACMSMGAYVAKYLNSM
jgi:uncharacterized flavoprotein (TIGR03862 family)